MVLLTMTAVVKKWRANPSGSHWGHFMGMLVQIQSLAILWHYISSHGHSTRVPRGIAETLNLPMQSLYCCHLLAFNHPYMLPHVLIPIYLDIIASVWFSWSVLNRLITNWFVQAGDQWKYHCELNCPDGLWQLFLLSLWNIFLHFHSITVQWQTWKFIMMSYIFMLPCHVSRRLKHYYLFVLFCSHHFDLFMWFSFRHEQWWISLYMVLVCHLWHCMSWLVHKPFWLQKLISHHWVFRQTIIRNITYKIQKTIVSHQKNT
jgi:hypothetical protein